MKKERAIQLIGTILASLVLLCIPWITHNHYPMWYYIALIIIMILGIYREIKYQRFEERFYRKWDKARQRGFAFHMVWQSIYSAIIVLALIILFRFLSNGYVWKYGEAMLTPKIIIATVIIIISIGIIRGIYTWSENEKRYAEIKRNDR